MDIHFWDMSFFNSVPALIHSGEKRLCQSIGCSIPVRTSADNQDIHITHSCILYEAYTGHCALAALVPDGPGMPAVHHEEGRQLHQKRGSPGQRIGDEQALRRMHSPENRKHPADADTADAQYRNGHGHQ